MTDDLFRRNTDLDKEFAKLRKDPQGTIEKLFRSGRRNRQHIWVLYGTVVFVLALVVYGAVASVAVRRLSHQTARLARDVAANSESITHACESLNAEHAKQVELWKFIIGLSAQSPQPNQTAAQRAQQRTSTEKLNGFLGETFAQERCPEPTSGL